MNPLYIALTKIAFMKCIPVLLIVTIISCCGNKATKSNLRNENSIASVSNGVSDSVPQCILAMINQFKKDGMQNPPRKILSYLYKNKTVYYVTPPCCDFFSDLYDNDCNLIGHPDGGFTGRGDGKLTDFTSSKSNEKIIWEDSRGGGQKK